MLKSRPVFLCLALVLAAARLDAKVHYVNKGVKYHIGDDRFNKSVDSEFLDAFPVVGQEWIQAFTVSEPDTVKIHIDHIWGVDDCSYCKVLVSIDDHDMGRLTAENNHESFDTLQPLAFRAVPGRTYHIKIASYGTVQVDDLAIEGVSVETEVADVKFMTPGPILKMPGDPMPKFTSEPKSPCDGAKKLQAWLPEEGRSKGYMDFTPLSAASEKAAALPLGLGEFVQVYAKIDEAGLGDRVSQALELLVGDPGTGWVFSFPGGSTSARHGNLKVKGRYVSSKFPVDAWKPGQWNELRLARCADGRGRLWLNGRELPLALDALDPSPLALSFKGLGVSAKLAEKPF